MKNQLIALALFSSSFSFLALAFSDPIENYRQCGLTKPGRLCDPKSVLVDTERTRASDALMKLPINVFAIVDASQHISYNVSELDINSTLSNIHIMHNDLSDVYQNFSLICQRHQSDCSSTQTLFVIEFLKMPAGSVGGERFDISRTAGPGPFSTSDQSLITTFDKALDVAMPDFAKMNLATGLTNFAQRFDDFYTKSKNVGWTAQSFPNPCLPSNPCGIGDRVDAYICDPDSVLNPEPRQRVNAELRSAGPGNRLYVAIGEPILGDLDSFTKALLSNWSVECRKRSRPQPIAVVAVSLSPRWSTNTDLLNATAVSSDPEIFGDSRPAINSALEDNSAMTSISDRLIEVARMFNASWYGDQWHKIVLTTPSSHSTTIRGRGNGCAHSRGLSLAFALLLIAAQFLLIS